MTYDPREAQKDDLALRVGALLLILGVCLLFGISTARDAVPHGVLLISGINTTGEVVGVERVDGQIEVTYAFIDRDGEPRRGIWRFRPSGHASCSSAAFKLPCVGDKVEITYARLDPDIHSVAGKDPKRMDFYIFAASILVGLLGLVLLGFMALKYIQYLKEGRYY